MEIEVEMEVSLHCIKHHPLLLFHSPPPFSVTIIKQFILDPVDKTRMDVFIFMWIYTAVVKELHSVGVMGFIR